MDIQKYKQNFSWVSIEVINWELESLRTIERTREVKEKVYFLLNLKNNLSEKQNYKLH